MIKILKPYEEDPTVREDHRGEKYFPKLEPVANENGDLELQINGLDTFEDVIQDSYQGTMLKNILARNGVQEGQGFYPSPEDFDDIAAMPETMADARAHLRNVQLYFDGLDADVRGKFENNVGVFLRRVADGTAAEVFQPAPQEVPNVVPAAPAESEVSQ